uniref:Uncharacterized protein n=1 Tax=Oryza meridionalis TaxID=40149 RepID=A0A0E0C6A1_9ORYZ
MAALTVASPRSRRHPTGGARRRGTASPGTTAQGVRLHDAQARHDADAAVVQVIGDAAAASSGNGNASVKNSAATEGTEVEAGPSDAAVRAGGWRGRRADAVGVVDSRQGRSPRYWRWLRLARRAPCPSAPRPRFAPPALGAAVDDKAEWSGVVGARLSPSAAALARRRRRSRPLTPPLHSCARPPMPPLRHRARPPTLPLRLLWSPFWCGGGGRLNSAAVAKAVRPPAQPTSSHGLETSTPDLITAVSRLTPPSPAAVRSAQPTTPTSHGGGAEAGE